MDKLPAHVIINIVQQGVSGPEPQLNLLPVCSDFYIAAIPILYHSPRVDTARKLQSLFSHTSLPAPKDHQKWSIRKLIAAGHTKIAACRFIRHLYISFTGVEIDRAEFLSSLTGASSKEIDSALKTFFKLPFNIMPDLQTLQLGDVKRNPLGKEGLAVNLVGADAAEGLMARGTPKVWCQHVSTATPIDFPRHDPELWEYHTPPILYNHVSPYTDINLFPGHTSYVYVHIHPHPDPEDVEYGSEGLAKWLGGAIASAFEIVESNFLPRGDNRKKLIRRSRIIIAFAASTSGDESLDPAEELQAMQKVAESAIAIAEQDQEDLRNVTIEVKSAAEMPVCPACGLGVNDA